jgi:uncharacterized membrane protein
MVTEIIRPTRAQAELELELLEIEAEGVETGELYASLRTLKLPREAAIRLEALTEVSRKIGDKIIAVGRIIVLKLLEFIKKHPHMIAGMALGAAVSVLISSSIPFFGTLLAPLALTLGIIIGGVAGHRLDKGVRESGGIFNIAQDVLEVAKDFFAMLVALFGAVSDELMAGSAA